MAKTRQSTRRRHVPQRTCIACRRTGDKRQLVRVVRTTDQGIQVDPTGKLSGRGAYLCQDRGCWDKALRHAMLERALKAKLADEEKAKLDSFAASLVQSTDDDLTWP